MHNFLLPASVVVLRDLSSFYGFFVKQIQSPIRAEAVISVAILQQLVDVFLVDFQSLALNVRTEVTAELARTLVGYKTGPF